MNKLPTIKVRGKMVSVIDRNHFEDDIAAAEAISRDAARYRWLRDQFHREDASDRYPGYRCWVSFYDDDKHDSVDSAIDAAMKKSE